MLAKTKVNQTFRAVAGNLVVKLLRFGRFDAQESQQISPHGIDSNPFAGETAVQGQTTILGQTVVLGYIQGNQEAGTGENFLFSTDENGARVFTIKLRNDGTAEVGGDADFAVRFNELKTAFDQLKSDYDDLVDQFNTHVASFNTHTHTVNAAPSTSPIPTLVPVAPSTASGTPSTADIDPARVDNVKLP